MNQSRKWSRNIQRRNRGSIMVKADNGTYYVNSKSALVSLLREKKDGSMISIVMESGTGNEDSDKLPFPDLAPLEKDDIAEALGEGDD